jgi:hypothetical protein
MDFPCYQTKNSLFGLQRIHLKNLMFQWVCAGDGERPFDGNSLYFLRPRQPNEDILVTCSVNVRPPKVDMLRVQIDVRYVP